MFHAWNMKIKWSKSKVYLEENFYRITTKFSS